MPLLSIVSPVYRAEKIIDELVRRIVAEVGAMTDAYEIILVEDGSPDGSWEKIVTHCEKNEKVKGIKLSRNFGQHFAITAGIDHAKGDFIIVMDCDLQDNPIYIPVLYAKAQEGYDIVFTKKKTRQHSSWKNLGAALFNRVFNYLIDNPDWQSQSEVGAFSLITQKVAVAYRNFQDYQRHYLMVLRWVGFRHTYIEVEHLPRLEGKSNYTLSKLLLHALNGITSQSDKLLRLNIGVGIAMSCLSFLAIIAIVVGYFSHGFLSGWASIMVTILFATGVLLTSIGILGIYLGKTFEQTKNRPKYLISEVHNTVE